MSYGKPKRVTVRAVAWFKPSMGLVKLNSDGGSWGNPGVSGGGGVIRDSNGNLVFGHSTFYGECTNSMAEIRTLHQGVFWLFSNGFYDSLIETDSGFIFGCLTKGHSPPWQCSYYICAILSMQQARRFVFFIAIVKPIWW